MCVLLPLLISRVLQFATQMFYQNHVRIENKTVRILLFTLIFQIKLPKICGWYSSDFNWTKANIVEALTPILNLEQNNKLGMVDPREIQIAYADYNWDLFIDPTKFYGCN